ncbi:MAG: zf-TFIIB domain-containing protein [Burkholderiaceae bacterium]
MLSAPACPSCRQPMSVNRFATHAGAPIELDICFTCQGLWFDKHENLKLSPDAVVELFRQLHEHRADQHLPLANTLSCPRCPKPLTKGFDLVRTGRYITYRCAGQHGRFSPFSSFMVEKGFVRHMTRPEIDDLAQRVGAVNCTSCGAPVDVRNEHACSYCKAPLSLLDPQAVMRAMEGYAQASANARAAAGQKSMADLGDALVALERDRSRAERERQNNRFSADDGASSNLLTVDLVAAGVSLVWGMLKDG